MSMINIAVVGSGYWGKNLVRNFHDLGVLSAICDKESTILDSFKEKYKGISTTEDLDYLLDESVFQIDAVAIATPAATHYNLAKKCLLAGKHVFVEKPLALTGEEGRDLIEIAEKNHLTLMVGHILQYHRAVIKLKELIDNGELGKIQYLYSNRLNIGKIRAEENILWSFAPHDISVILMLLREMPESVCATGGAYLQQKIPDTTLTTLDFPSGVKAHIFVSWLHPFKEQKLVVVGDKKMAVFDDISDEKLMLYPHRIEWLNRIPIAAKAEAEAVKVEMDEPLKAECTHFIDCVTNGQQPITDGREGLRVLQVLQASQRSLNENGRKINLNQNAVPISKRQQSVSAEAAMNDEQRAKSYFVHESAYVDEGVEIGIGTKVWHFSHILSGSRIGKNCNIGQNVVIGPDVTIGNGCKIQNNVSVYKGVTLEDEVFCGPSIVFTNVYNPRGAIRRMGELRPTLVKKGATIGANATIICGITIGTSAFIGTGTVVLTDVPDYALMVGNPAKQKGWMCACGIQLVFKGNRAKCMACKRKYKKVGPEKIVEE
ncbi:MAG: Gfo/Idh/MocA family oxidoreductase [Deltaproteobacteria bacterium]|nr:Gfo/Idh/MocA family oxidoreductase [Deltaproteobacteria bacterium]